MAENYFGGYYSQDIVKGFGGAGIYATDQRIILSTKLPRSGGHLFGMSGGMPIFYSFGSYKEPLIEQRVQEGNIHPDGFRWVLYDEGITLEELEGIKNIEWKKEEITRLEFSASKGSGSRVLGQAYAFGGKTYLIIESKSNSIELWVRGEFLCKLLSNLLKLAYPEIYKETFY